MPICLLSLNHRYAPIDLRERAVIGQERLAEAYQHMRNMDGIEEAMLYSTCERTELLWMGAVDSGIQWLCAFHGVDEALFDGHYQVYQDQKAIEHAIEVATGLQSSLLGEPQILGQFKAAFRQAKTLGAFCGPLQRVVTKILESAKALRTQLPIGEGSTTPASAVLHLAQTIFTDIKTCRWLCVGTGQIMQHCLPYIERSTDQTITLFSRHCNQTRPWATDCMTFMPIEQLSQVMVDADIIVTATSHPLPIIGKGLIEKTMKKRLYRPLLIADLAVPRNVEPECAECSGVYLFDLDALHDIIDTHQHKRGQIKEKLLPYVQEHAKACLEQLNLMRANSVIAEYRNHIEQLSAQTHAQIQPILKDDPKGQKRVEQLLYQLTQKILHGPTQQLRVAAQKQDHTLLRSIEQLLTHKDDAS